MQVETGILDGYNGNYANLESQIDLLKKEFQTVLLADKVLISINVELLLYFSACMARISMINL
jgi:hypothetical protein